MIVLLVEDHTDTRSVLDMLLNRCGYQTVTAKSLKEARTRLEEMSFDIVVTDLSLPDDDGLDLVREAKQTHKLKAIAVTGRTSDEERNRGLKAGVDCYLTKPIDYEQLKQALGFPDESNKSSEIQEQSLPSVGGFGIRQSRRDGAA